MASYLLISSCSKTCGGHLKFGMPNEPDQMFCRDAYALGYSHQYKNPQWVSYLASAEALDIDIIETDNYRYDEDIEEEGRFSFFDYRKINYSMVRLAEGKITRTEDAIDQTYLLSNTVPQLPQFNQGIWQQLNEHENELIYEHQSVYVVTGPVFSGFNRTVGENNWAIPSHFYKVFYFPDNNEMQGFLLPHEDSLSSNLFDYITSIDQIELLTDLDFFHKMLNADEDRLEAKTSP